MTQFTRPIYKNPFKLVGVIAETALDNAQLLLTQYQSQVDIVELRLDYLYPYDISAIKHLKDQVNRPIIFTLRPISQGGNYSGNEVDRQSDLIAIAQLAPDYIDIESHVPKTFLTQFHIQFPHIKIIRSHHDLNQTPQDLSTILNYMQHPSVAIYKTIFYANNTLDNFRVATWTKEKVRQYPLVAHCMGDLSCPSRLLGTAMGNRLHYARLTTHTNQDNLVRGCLNIKTWLNVYRIRNIQTNTRFFGLLGDPITPSIGHIFHNNQFAKRGINAIYLKIQLTPQQLDPFFKYIQELPFDGFSVTTPLKEAVVPYMNKIHIDAQQLPAINTIKIYQGKRYGINTDGIGALEAIESIEPVTHKKILILGAGGTAKAIASEAAKRSYQPITLVNRTISKAQAIAEKIKGHSYYFEKFQTYATLFDVIINTIPCSNPAVNKTIIQCLQKTSHADTLLLNCDYSDKGQQLTKQLSCRILNGYDMYAQQALKQIEYWFDNE